MGPGGPRLRRCTTAASMGAEPGSPRLRRCTTAASVGAEPSRCRDVRHSLPANSLGLSQALEAPRPAPESSILAKRMAKKVWLHRLCETGHGKRRSAVGLGGCGARPRSGTGTCAWGNTHPTRRGEGGLDFLQYVNSAIVRLK